MGDVGQREGERGRQRGTRRGTIGQGWRIKVRGDRMGGEEEEVKCERMEGGGEGARGGCRDQEGKNVEMGERREAWEEGASKEESK